VNHLTKARAYRKQMCSAGTVFKININYSKFVSLRKVKQMSFGTNVVETVSL